MRDAIFFAFSRFIFSRLLGGAFLSHIYARITSDLRESGTKAHEGSGKMLAIPCPSPLFRKHGLAEELEWAWDRMPLRVDKIGCGFAKQFQVGLIALRSPFTIFALQEKRMTNHADDLCILRFEHPGG